MFYNGFASIGKCWSCCCFSFHRLSIKLTTRCPVSLQNLWILFCWLGWSLWSLKDILWQAMQCFCCCYWILWLCSGWNQCIYIPHCKHQVKPHSSPWLSVACAAAIVHRNDFFICTNKIIFQNLKKSSGKIVIDAKGFFKLPNLYMLITQKSPSLTSQKLGSCDFLWTANIVLIKGKPAKPPLFNGLEVLCSASVKAKLFAKNF